MNKLLVLIWKHIVARGQNKSKTFFELCIPILLFLPAFLIQSNISGNTIDDLSHFESEPVSNEYMYEYVQLKTVLFAPNNSDFYNRLMEEVAVKLRARKSDMIGYLNENDLLEAKRKDMENDNTLLAVIFEGSNIDNPVNLNYSIRSALRYKTYKIKPSSAASEPHDQYGQIYQYFVAIQMAVDTTFIEMKSENTINKEIWTRPFPYPPYLKDEYNSIKYDTILPLSVVNCYLLIILFIIGRLTIEKSSGIRELMKMMGTDSKLLWLVHYIDCLTMQLVSISVLVFLLKFGSYPLIPNTNPIILWITLFLYVNYIILLSFAISTCFSDVTLASVTVIVIWIFSQIFASLEAKGIDKMFLVYITSLVPNVPMFWIFRIIGIFEIQQIGIQFSNMYQTTVHFSLVSFGTAVTFLFINTLLCIPIIWYIDSVKPGQFGLPKPYGFIFEKSYWYSKKTSPTVKQSLKGSRNSLIIEDISENSTASIKIHEISKIFSLPGGFERVALDQVSFEIYKGGITALLGHNGAGKTTLMSIITGMFPATSGDVIIDDLNIKYDMAKIRHKIGLCPQYNMTFKDLTVKQHIIFFAMMQNHTMKSAEKKCDDVLKKLKLDDKKNEFSCNLSGGGQRRLQLAIALAGNAPVLILDEPTTGLDPEHRRQLWDILLSLRKEHTILLTTHFMEEADVLGDRIAIIDHGHLKCYGTSMYLKTKICPGYKLNILKVPNAKESFISDQIKTFYSTDFRKKSENSENSNYILESKDSGRLLNLLSSFEKNKKDMGIESYELLSSTMEDVFLKICSSNDKDLPSEPVENISPVKNMFGGIEAFWGLTVKREIYIKSTLTKIIPQVLLSVLLIVSGIFFTLATEQTPINKSINLNLSLYQYKQDVIYSTHDDVIIHPEKLIYSPNINWKHANQSSFNEILELAKKNISQYNSNLLNGISFNKDKYTGFYSVSVYHALPIVLNLISNIFAAQELNYTSGNIPYITTYNNPIEKDLQRKLIENTVRPVSLTLIWSYLTSLGWGILLNIFISLPVKERCSGARELQFLTGISPLSYWAIFLFHDFIICSVFLLLIFFLGFDPYETFTSDVFVPILALEIVHILGALAFIYFISYFVSSAVSGYVILMTMTFFNCFISIIVYMQETLKNKIFILNFITHILRFVPSFNFDLGLLKISHIARERMLCKRNHDIAYTNLSFADNIEYCCDKDEITGECIGLSDYYTNESFGIKYELIWIGFMYLLYMILILSIEEKIFEKLKEKVLKKYAILTNQLGSDLETVACGFPETPLLAIENVHKIYLKGINMCKKERNATLAVKSLSIKVARGDCFGLIGVNGAGKSTTFKILTGNVIPTKGHISINNLKIDKNRKEFLNLLSYCPQFDAVGDYMTARESLTLFCRLRNVPKNVINCEVKNVLKLTGLEDYSDVPSYLYSGGNKRKLSLAVSIIGLDYLDGRNSILVLLDEPTSGVDPCSRKSLHDIIQKVNKSGKTIIISSHSMSECESLCNNIGILVNGQLVRMDNVQKVKQTIDVGYLLTVKLKLTMDHDVTDNATEVRGNCDSHEATPKDVNDLKNSIQNSFIGHRCQLTDDHETLLQYRIMDKSLWYGDVLSKIIKIRNKFPRLIEDYSISDPTLEDAFLAINKSLNESSNN